MDNVTEDSYAVCFQISKPLLKHIADVIREEKGLESVNFTEAEEYCHMKFVDRTSVDYFNVLFKDEAHYFMFMLKWGLWNY